MSDEYLAYLEAAVRNAGFEVKHDGGTLGNSNFRIEPIVRHGMAEQALAGEIAKAVFRDEQDGGCDLSAGMFGKSMTHLIRNIVRNYLATPTLREAVAYLDIGAGGYLDLGSDLSDEQLLALPKGRHALAIIGTFGIDGYVAAPVPAAPGIDLRGVVLEYIAARDAHELATRPLNSHAPVRQLPHGSPITRRWVDARETLRLAMTDASPKVGSEAVVSDASARRMLEGIHRANGGSMANKYFTDQQVDQMRLLMMTALRTIGGDAEVIS